MLLAVLLAATPLAGSAAPGGARGAGTVGASGAGDDYFPSYGNGGYDVQHYVVRVRYGVKSQNLLGKTTVQAIATQDLSQFNLDLSLPAQKVFVDGVAAGFTQGRHELVVTPAATLTSGAAFVVKVIYAGKPGDVPRVGLGGWFETADGAVAAGEPEVAVLWYPSNDHPTDKATFDIYAQTNTGTQAISNGTLLGRKVIGDDTQWHWQVTEPMATYLATVVFGDYDIVEGTTPAGTPYLYAITQHLTGDPRRNAWRSLRITPQVTDFYADRFGGYPFASIGGTLLNADFGFSLENQTRPNYSKVFFNGGPDKEVVAHEIAHMWWGDSVSLKRWRHVWLNEGFATWSSWLYLASEDGATFSVNDIFAKNYRSLKDYKPFWQLKISDPGNRRVFDLAVYYRGAMALQALRNLIGQSNHNRLMRRWAKDHRGDVGTVPQFKALAEEISGRDLNSFFAAWLNHTRRPLPSKALGFPNSLLGRTAAHTVPDELVARTKPLH